MSAEYLAKYGADVIANGYLIVPIVKGSKAPGLGFPAKKWSTIRADDARLQKWIGEGYGGNGVGVLSSRSPGVDMDCQDADLVDQLRAFTVARLGETIERVGLPPKTLLVYRADTQFPKVNSSVFIDSMGRTAKLEVLGDGQQFVALHIHPDTKKPYRWKDQKGVHNTPLMSLPNIELEDAEAIRDEFERMCRERGWSEKKSLNRIQGGEIDRSNPFIHDQPKIHDLSDQEIRAKLLLVPDAQDYEIWLQIGMALFHQYDGGQDGLDLWHEWSATASNYDHKALENKWGSFDIEGKKRPPMTARLILKLAQKEEKRIATEAMADIKVRLLEADTTDELELVAAEVKQIQFTRLAREILAGVVKQQIKKLSGQAPTIGMCRDMVRYEDPAHGEVPHWMVGFVYVQLDETFYNTKTRRHLTTKGFDQSFSRYMLSRAEILEGKSSPEHLPSHMALNVLQIPTVANKMYMPGEDDLFSLDGIPYVNFYSPDNLPEMPEIISPSGQRCIDRVQGHVQHLFPYADDGELLLDWIAYIVQTGGRVNWAPVIQGVQGDGKTWFAELMQAMLGRTNVAVIKGKALEEQYNPWAEGHQIVFIEEVRLHGKNRFDAVNNLKTNITNSSVEIRRMRTDIYNVINQSSYFLTTNSRDGLPIDQTDTRYFPMFSRWQRKEELVAFMEANPEYYNDLYASLNEPGVLRGWFMQRTLSERFDPRKRAPVSTARWQMVELSKTEETDSFDIALEEDPAFDFCDVLLDSAQCGAKMTGHGASAPYGAALTRLLDGAGFSTLGRHKIDGKNRRLWSRTPERFYDDKGQPDVAAIRAYYKSKQGLDLEGL